MEEGFGKITEDSDEDGVRDASGSRSEVFEGKVEGSTRADPDAEGSTALEMVGCALWHAVSERMRSRARRKANRREEKAE